MDHCTAAQGTGEAAATARRLHDDLRDRVLRLTLENYEATGFLWENYDEKRGTGRGCRPFTGWTALLVLILQAEYFEI